MIGKRQGQDWNTVSLVINPLLFLEGKKKSKETQLRYMHTSLCFLLLQHAPDFVKR